MWILRILVLILASRVGLCAEFTFAKNANSYGPYVLTLNKYEMCRGPKSNNVTVINADIFTNDTIAMITYNITFITAARISEIKVHVSHLNGNQKSTLWNYNVDKPCQHFAIGSIMEKYLPMQRNCIVKKGDFYFVLDFTAICRQFFGEMFFYGEFMFKTTILAPQGNIMCFIIELAFAKQKA